MSSVVLVLEVVVCIKHSHKEPYRQIAKDRVASLERLDGEIVSTLAQNARDVGSIPALGAIFPIFITPITFIKHWLYHRLNHEQEIANNIVQRYIMSIYRLCI